MTGRRRTSTSIIAVRYELELALDRGRRPENYTLAEDVDAEALAAVMELGVRGRRGRKRHGARV
ncbi:MAG: hypothetical protein ACLU3I_00545 [Acutalibacteraceae bacterium]